MPGIVGIIGRRPAGESERFVKAMIGTMAHEPFYKGGLHVVPEMGVYVGWAAHEHSFASQQSIRSRYGDIAMVWSGECVANQEDAATAPTADGIARRYSEIGDHVVGQLNGLFAGVLIDRAQNRALLFNDRYGVERLYVHEADDGVYFASEAKALLRILPELRAFDDNGVAQFFAFGCTLGTQTLFRGIRLLEGGSLWTFQNGERRRTRYFVPESWASQTPLTASAFESEFQETFNSVLPRYTGGRIGISLTGGLDTRMLMACLSESKIRPVSYTFSGLQDETLDERLAAQVARTCGSLHKVLRIGHDFLANYGSYVDRTVYVTDGGAGAVGAHEIYLNAKARHLAPIRLTGNFGSEVFRSMSTFKPIGLSHGFLRRDVDELVTALAQDSSYVREHPVTFAAFREVPWSLFGSMTAARTQVVFRTPYLDNDLVALAFRAPAESRQSPGPALRLVQHYQPALARIPTDRGLLGGSCAAQLARRLFAEVTFKLDYLHKEGLPGWLAPMERPLGSLSRLGLLGQHKYLPYRLWFRGELAPHVMAVLTDPQTARLPYWSRKALASVARDHLKGRGNHVREINAILMLEGIERLLIRGAADGQATAPVSIIDRVAARR